jgi:hypothetical protein
MQTAYYTERPTRPRKASDASEDCCAICGPLGDVKPTVETAAGRAINPTYDYLRKWDLALEPFTDPLPVGATLEFTMFNEAEENTLGDFVVSQLHAAPSPVPARFAVQIRSQQNDRVLSNGMVLDRFVFTNTQLCRNLPCCFLIEAGNFVQFRVQNLEGVPILPQVIARGRRILPYQSPEMRGQLLSYWNRQKTTPYWLVPDRVQGAAGVALVAGSGVTVPASGRAICFATVPEGDFEWKELRALVDGTDADNILINIVDGVGRSHMSRPLPLGSLSAAINTTVAGFQGGQFRAAAAGRCQQYGQFLKRNTRVRIELQNTDAVNPVTVFLAFEGCAHYYNECPPGRGLERELSLEPSVGPLLVTAPRCPPPQASRAFDPMRVPPRGIPQAGYVPPPPPPTYSQYDLRYAQQQAAPRNPEPILGYGYGAALGPGGLTSHAPGAGFFDGLGELTPGQQFDDGSEVAGGSW